MTCEGFQTSTREAYRKMSNIKNLVYNLVEEFDCKYLTLIIHVSPLSVDDNMAYIFDAEKYLKRWSEAQSF